MVELAERFDISANPALLKAFDVNKSSVILNKENKPIKYERGDAWADIAVYHPNTNYIDDRPDWLFDSKNKNVAIPLSDIGIDFPVLILAYKKGEDINLTIPVDITEASHTDNICHLSLIHI